MRSPWIGLRNYLGLTRRGRTIVRRKAATRLFLEHLETRNLFNASPTTVAVTDPLLAAMAAAQAGQKDSPDGPYTKAGSELAQLYSEYEQAAANGGTASFQPTNPLWHVQNGDVLIDATASGSASELANDLTAEGAHVTGTYGSMVSAWLPIGEISAASQLSSLKFAHPSEMASSAGVVQSQGDTAIYADQARTIDHVDGSGTTVGVMSDSFNAKGGYAGDVANGDLPSVNVIEEDPYSGGTDEGRAMAQVVHDVAPGANIDFYTAANGEADFANGITTLAADGANIIVDDYSYYDEPFFQDGIIAQAANNAVVNYGVSYFSAAANNGTQSYEANYNPGFYYSPGYFASAYGAPYFDGGTAHNFDNSGYDDQQSFTLANNADINLTFCWQQPNYSVSGGSGSQVDMDIYILDSNNVVVAGDNTGNLGGNAEARVYLQNTSGVAQTYKVMIVEYSSEGGASPGLLKYINFTDGTDTMQNLAYATNSSTSVGHSNAEYVQAVGAAYYGNTPRYGVSPADIEPYSSASGDPLLFDTLGSSVYFIKDQYNNGLIVAPDGTDTSFFGSYDSDGDGYLNFFGTSEAAPHAAAVAALMNQAAGYHLNPFTTYSYMEQTASDMGASGFDYRTGFGLINAEAAVADVDSPTGSWNFLNHQGLDSNGTGTMLLQSDGSVMVQGGNVNANWYKLTPDSNGSYIDGAWSQLASMHVARLYGGSNVLPNGQTLFLGGEYASDNNLSNTGEVYNPLNNTWTYIANFPQSSFGDDPTVMLPNGDVLAGYIFGPQTYIYDPASNTWTQTGSKLRNDQSDEESWVELPDGSILSYDIFASISSGVGSAQRYIPATGQWIDAGTVPVALSSTSTGYEMGPALLLPDGRVFVLGSTGNTAFYDPSTNSWTAGPVIPDGLTSGDAPAAVLANGDVLFAAAPAIYPNGNGGWNYPGPTTLFLFDPSNNTYTNVTPGNYNLNGPSYVTRMLALPNGQVLLTNSSNQLLVYTPSGTPAAAQPAISRIDANGGGSFTITGTQLNGFSEGAAYGDDAEMSSNYPIIQLTDLAGNVHYARTYNWSSTGVDTGSTPVSAQFTLPSGVGPGMYYLSVIANGIASAPVLAIFTTTGNDAVLLSTNGLGGVYASLNGQVHSFLNGQVTAVDVVNEGGNDTTTVYATPAGVPLHISGDGSDTVDLGLNGTVQYIQGAVSIENQPAYTTINIDDSADTNSNTVTIGTFTPSGDSSWSYISGLGGAATISYENFDTSNVTVNTGTGSNSIYVYATAVPLYLNNAGSAYVDVGVGNTSGINGLVDVYGSGATQLIVDDSGDSTGRTVTMNDGSLFGLGAGGVYWTPTSSSTGGVTYVNVDGGSGGNTFNVNNTSSLYYYTLLSTGTGSDTVNVYATTGNLYDYNPGGYDNTYVGLGSTGNLNGWVDAYGSGSTYLYVNDSNDTTGRTVTMNDGSLFGLGAGGVYWTPSASSTGGVTYLEVDGGSGGNTFNVNNTSNFYYSTYLQTGAGNDIINISATQGKLDAYNSGGADSIDVGLGTVANINGLVNVSGSGTNTLLVDDHLDTAVRKANLTSSQLTGLGNTGAISYDSSVTSLTIDGSKAGSTYNIQSTSANTPVTINGGGSTDTFNIGDSSNTLNSIAGAVTINGGSGSNTLNVKDQGSTAGQNYTLSKTVLARSGVSITYSYLSHLYVYASNGGNDSLTLQYPTPTVATTFYGGSGTNTLQGANTTNTWTINKADGGTVGKVTYSNFQYLIGGTSTDTFKFTGSGSVSGTISGGGGSSNKLDYSSLSSTVTVSVTLSSATSGMANAIASGFSGINNVAGNSNTANTLTAPNLVNLWTISGANKGTLQAGSTRFTFAGMPNLVGGTDVDTFKFSSATSSKELSINGGGVTTTGEGDWLDYSSFSSSSTVNVNLATGAASNINGGAAGAVSNIQNVIGSSTGINNLTGDDQGNILLGGNGTTTNRQVNTIVGGNGRSLLIGGGGGGSVMGGSDEDILIAGTTTFNPTTTAGKLALMKILYEWQRTDKTFSQRVTDLKSGGGYNGSDKLIWSGTGTTVHKSLGSFTLTGDPAEATTADWFFANTSGTGAISTISDLDDEPGETDQVN